ncbi:MAG: DUF5667 domain-containing protein [Patescibacteria group bacterium]
MTRHILIALTVIGIACGVGSALAHDEGLQLPSAGLTPSNFFYFLDRWGEAIKNLFTIGVENKAKLQLEFAAERVSEISLETQILGDGSPGVMIAKERLVDHLKEGKEILLEAEDNGQDVVEARSEFFAGIDELYEDADWLDDFTEESGDDNLGNTLGIPDEGEIDEDSIRELERLEFEIKKLDAEPSVVKPSAP